MSKNPIKNNLVIELHVPDFEVVKNFYGALGFEIIMEHVVTENTPGYLVMQRSDELGATMINFYGGNDLVYNQSYFKNFPNTTQCGYGVEVTVPVADLDVFYDSIKDKIMSLKTYQIRSTDVTIYKEDEASEEEKTVETYYNGDGTFIKKYVPNENEETLNKFKRLYVKSKNKYDLPSLHINTDKYYRSLLGQITSRKQFLQAMEEGKIDFKIELEKYLSKEQQDQIEKDNPDNIVVDGIDYKVEYSDYYSEIKNRAVIIEMRPEDFLKLTE